MFGVSKSRLKMQILAKTPDEVCQSQKTQMGERTFILSLNVTWFFVHFYIILDPKWPFFEQLSTEAIHFFTDGNKTKLINKQFVFRFWEMNLPL